MYFITNTLFIGISVNLIAYRCTFRSYGTAQFKLEIYTRVLVWSLEKFVREFVCFTRSYAHEGRSSEVTLLASSRVACKCYCYSTRAVCARKAHLVQWHGSLSGTPTGVSVHMYTHI